MIFQKKDMDTWDRAEIFCHFIDELRCVMSMTVELCGDMDAGFELKEKQRPEKRALFVLWIPLHRLMEGTADDLFLLFAG
ncbi:MAG: hypothetical protein ACLU9L_07845 [Christensenellales bacterium]